jgi:hypothetical protein
MKKDSRVGESGFFCKDFMSRLSILSASHFFLEPRQSSFQQPKSPDKASVLQMLTIYNNGESTVVFPYPLQYEMERIKQFYLFTMLIHQATFSIIE